MNNDNKGGGINLYCGGFFGLTFLVLLVLKLTGLASISWWIVFLPLMIPVAIVIVLIGIFWFCVLR